MTSAYPHIPRGAANPRRKSETERDKERGMLFIEAVTMQARRCLLMLHVTVIAGDRTVVVTRGAMSPQRQQAASGQGYVAQERICIYSAGKHQSYIGKSREMHGKTL